MKELEYLLVSAGKSKVSLTEDNPFKDIGFDADKPRLGWVNPPPWEMVEETIKRLAAVIKDKEEFIFVGIGGSANGIKTLISLKKGCPLYFLDSLDPRAVKDVLSKVKNIGRTLVVLISKSGTTVETQALAGTLKGLFKDNWRDHFLWLSDEEAFPKINYLGWERVHRFTIQIDGNSDIGGRFTCPHTLIFLFPLFLIMNRDISALKELFLKYLSSREGITAKAVCDVSRYKDKEKAFFSIRVREEVVDKFTTWATQLFQESLGSKKEGFYVKTLVRKEEKEEDGFSLLEIDSLLPKGTGSHFLYLMGLMYYLQLFVALYAGLKNINFVNQPYVEEYKRAMRQLSKDDLVVPEKIDLPKLLEKIKAKLNPSLRFIEVVLYFYPQDDFVKKLKEELDETLGEKKSFVFVGSDWNHHSYQAAFLDKETLFVILTKEDYLSEDIPYLNKDNFCRNVDTLKLISLATYKTLQDKALYFCI